LHDGPVTVVAVVAVVVVAVVEDTAHFCDYVQFDHILNMLPFLGANNDLNQISIFK